MRKTLMLLPLLAVLSSCSNLAYTQEAAFHWSALTKDVAPVATQKLRDLPNLLGTGQTGEFHIFGGMALRTSEPVGGASVVLPLAIAANAEVFLGPALTFQEGTPTGAGLLLGARFRPSPTEALAFGVSPAGSRVSLGLQYARRF